MQLLWQNIKAKGHWILIINSTQYAKFMKQTLAMIKYING